MERAPASPDAASSASSSSSSREDRASEAARLAVQGPVAVAVAVAVSEPPAYSADKVPLTEGAAPAAAAAAAEGEGEDGAEAEESAWADDQEELGHCSRSPWCHAFVYSVVTGVVTFFVLMFLHRF